MEREETLNAVEQYVTLFNEVKTRVNDDQAAVSILEQIGKDSRVEKMLEQRGIGAVRADSLENGESLASWKQMNYLKSLGVTVPDRPLTRTEAPTMIDEALGTNGSA